VLYKYMASEHLPEDVLNSTLGKKRKVQPNSDLELALAHEYVRDYVVSDKDVLNLVSHKQSSLPL